jgi:hypothetical protein
MDFDGITWALDCGFGCPAATAPFLARAAGVLIFLEARA